MLLEQELIKGITETLLLLFGSSLTEESAYSDRYSLLFGFEDDKRVLFNHLGLDNDYPKECEFLVNQAIDNLKKQYLVEEYDCLSEFEQIVFITEECITDLMYTYQIKVDEVLDSIAFFDEKYEKQVRVNIEYFQDYICSSNNTIH